jgi:hypothetical protein
MRLHLENINYDEYINCMKKIDIGNDTKCKEIIIKILSQL